MFEVGDIVRFYSPTAGKQKFHLCLGQRGEFPVFAFLHLNSGTGYRGDLTLDDGLVPGLPPSPTGKTVISFSIVVQMNKEQLAKFDAQKTGAIDSHLAGDLAGFAKTLTVLSHSDRAFVVAALESLFS
jgi:hypothetical protein